MIINNKLNKYELSNAIVFILAGFALIFYIIPDQIDGTGQLPDARTIPYLFSMILIVLSMKWAINVYCKRKEYENRKVYVGVGIGLLFLIMVSFLELFGYIISGVLIISFVAYMINKEKPVRIIIFSIITTLVYYAFFKSTLHIMFPTGMILP